MSGKFQSKWYQSSITTIKMSPNVPIGKLILSNIVSGEPAGIHWLPNVSGCNGMIWPTVKDC